MEARLKEAIRKYVRERNIQKTLDEMSVTANVAGYDTPAAFSKPGQTAKKNKRLANVTGGEVVDDLEEGITSSAGAPFTKPSDVAGKNAKLAKLSGATVVGEEKQPTIGHWSPKIPYQRRTLFIGCIHCSAQWHTGYQRW
jgi:hypothetical protein